MLSKRVKNYINEFESKTSCKAFLEENRELLM